MSSYFCATLYMVEQEIASKICTVKLCRQRKMFVTVNRYKGKFLFEISLFFPFQGAVNRTGEQF
jgi:hypothetical protein